MHCKMALNDAERNLIFEQRYVIFVEEFHFFAPRSDGRKIECDNYDDYSALFGVWEKNVLLASCRLVLPYSPLGLPTLNSMRVDRDAMDHTLSRAEISRITVFSEHRTFKKTTKILQTMQEELCRFAVDSRIQQFIGAVEPAFLRLLNCAMLAYKPFGPLQYHIGAERYPVFFSVHDCNSDAQEY